MNSSVQLSNSHTSQSVFGGLNSTGQPVVSQERAAWWSMLLATLTIIVTVVADLLVILSFVMEPRLRVPFNYYILSLTICDQLIGALDMSQLTAGYTYSGFGRTPMHSALSGCTWTTLYLRLASGHWSS